MNRRKKIRILAVSFVALAVVIALGFYLYASSKKEKFNNGGGSTNGTVLRIVAAENFWGSIASQIGGSHVQVFSIVSDPNADPHEYESSAVNARAVADADYVIENGAGYDSWMDKLLAAGSGVGSVTGGRKVMNVARLVGVPNGENPHLWYNPDYVNAAAVQIEQDLAAIDPGDAPYYETQYKALQMALTGPGGYQARIATIKQQFAGTKIAATEDIFTYLANAAGLTLVSPPAFIEAVAEGNDPPAASVVQFEDQLRATGANAVKLMVYNEQTVTPLTSSMKALAAQENIPIVGVTETIQPPDISFQDWMSAEVIDVQNALTVDALGK